MSELGRRDVLRLGGLAWLATAGLVACGEPGQTGELLRSGVPLPQPFSRPYRKPPVLRPTSTAGGTDTYRVRARMAQAEILPGVRTPILGYEGIFPGPTIESRRGRRTVVEHVNELPVPMVVHLHGGVTGPVDDGYPTDLVLPLNRSAQGAGTVAGHGMQADPEADVVTGRRSYSYPMEQDAATLWYHDHRMDFTGPMVYRGLAGLHLVRDDEEDALGLPSGDRELPLVIADRAFDADGRLSYPARDASMTHTPGVRDDWFEGVLADVVLVNGVPWPDAEVPGARHRLRIVNASNARRYTLRLDPPAPFVQIGSDQGLLASPVEHDTLTIAPGERYDVVVDFAAYAAGTRVRLRNTLGEGTTADVMSFSVGDAIRDDSRVPSALRTVPALDPPRGTIRRTLRFRSGSTDHGRGWLINQEPFSPTRSVASVRAGDTEIWRVGTDLHHPFHLHLGRFQVLRRAGRDAGAQDAGWKDTVDVRPAEDVELAVQFPRGHSGRYVLHCHNLEHEDMGMMATFTVR